MTNANDTTDEPIDVLNLYAGIGGNRKLWEDVNVTAVEWDEDKAEVYRDHSPDDEVIVTDAHEYLLNHYREYDAIWSSPPCPTHSRTNIMSVLSDDERAGNDHRSARYPDMKLYEEIILLENFAPSETAWVVENTVSYYDPLIEPQKVQRHYFWANFRIPTIELVYDNISRGSVELWQEKFGFDLGDYEFSDEKRKVLRNCVHPELGQHVFDAAVGGVQQTLSEVTTT
jgi:DNA (cytosine-5)-methyltransferase 1